MKFYSFPVPTEVSHQVKFWHSIFAQYHGHHSVIHDRDLPNIVIDVIDFQVFAQRFNQGYPYERSDQKRIRRKYIERYELAIQRFKEEGRKAVRHGLMEERILKVYSQHDEGLAHLFTRPVNLRVQTGLADEFQRAAERSKKYLPYMEDIFREHNIPVDLTRLAFVESMFNERAVSKVGASGIWQFMPATARRFIKVNRYIDERNSPLKASLAAAKYMGTNFRRLKTWPLTITAYNHGAGGVRRAMRRLRTNDLGKIIRHYRHRTFGFASKNFYAEFLAANIVYKQKYRQDFDNRNPLEIERLKIKQRVTLNELIQKTPLDEETIKKFNFCLKNQAFHRYRNRPLPRNFELIIPKTMARAVERDIQEIARMSPREKRRYRL
ncbi:lytic transglycosylase domain-containing protein [Pseudobacteriovorax antillogorgiicola]|uniref:lytic transglycosylase domain-containing protein n=1 Tax=Pseudobacteriovorax antillogorgiicola TaxID=1513793 RepID=UPI0013566BF5|nr:lytic transglycosylase domain-containing protein [Pseudobacteriovorax antillogorgiicola]